jgi:hypothetical protein
LSFAAFNRVISIDRKSGAVHLNKVDSVGIAWVVNKEFTNGTIEFDVKGEDLYQESFVGIAFHGLNNTTYEAVYFRPFNFHAVDPGRKSHAVQYIANPKYDWPKLRADFPNKYEQQMLPDVDAEQWFHVKLLVSGRKVNVYINGSDKQVLALHSLAQSGGKMVGLWVGNGSGGDWKNLKIHP